MSRQNNTGKLSLKTALSLSVGFGAIAAHGGGLAVAQDEAEAEDTRRLTAVVVEATRREGVTVQDVPVAVTALDAALLDETNFNRVNDLEQIAPSIQITQTESVGSGTSISIRGIGTGSNNLGFEPAVGVLIDGVFRTRTGSALSELPDLQGVEVLRGPQGTLFGRNTSSGVVSVSTKKPSQESETTVTLGIENYNGFVAGFSTTGALSENWSGRLDAKVRQRDGYIDDVNSDREFNNIDRFMLRGQALYEGPDSEIRLIMDYFQTDEQCCVAVNLDEGATAGLIADSVVAPQGLDGIYQGDPFEYKVAISPNRDFNDSITEFGVSAQWDKTLDIGRLTSITAYRNWLNERNQDIDFSGIDRAYREGFEGQDKTFTQELRLQGESGNIDWLVGAFYMNQDLSLYDPITYGTEAAEYADGFFVTSGLSVHGTVPLPSLLSLADPALATTYIPAPEEGDGSLNEYNIKTNALAVFTHNEINLSDPMTLTVGLRYNYEEKELDETFNATNASCDFLENDPLGATAIFLLGPDLTPLVCNPVVNPTGNGNHTDSFDEGELTGTLKLSYEVNSDILLYGSYARGYKSGSWNLDSSATGDDPDTPNELGGASRNPDDQQFDSELVDAYELGWKATFANGLATLNGAIFYQDITDYQINVFTGVNFQTFNVAAETQGLELDLTASPVENLVIQGGYAYTESIVKDTVIARDGVTVLIQGDVQQSNVPEHVLTGAATFTPQLTNNIDGLFHVNFRWNDEINAAGGDLTELTMNDAYALIGARVGIKGNDGRWELSLYGENLTEEEYYYSGFVVPEQDAVAVYPSTPSFYGVEAKIRF